MQNLFHQITSYYYTVPLSLCVQMDFTRTFETVTKCNNINHVWNHFYKTLVVLKYYRCPWANIFDTDIFRYINTYIKLVYWAFFGIFMLLQIFLNHVNSFPITDGCDQSNVIYQADVYEENKIMRFFGSNERQFKQRYRVHKSSFKKRPKYHTKISSHIWKL